MVNDTCEFPYKINSVDCETNEKLLNDFRGERTGFVQVGSKEYFFPYKFSKEAEKYYNIEVRTDDIWIVSFPRSGTTLTQELVWLIKNDLDYNTAAKIPLDKRFPFFEYGIFLHDDLKQEFLEINSFSELNQNVINQMSIPGWEVLPTIKSPRFIKTHLPFSLLPKDWHTKRCKTIYVARNPKDVVVSFYHLNRLSKTQGFLGDFKKYWQYFQNNLQPWTPYWRHIEEAWNIKNQSNVLFLFYEDIISDMESTIKKIASFLGKSLNEKEISGLKNHLSFENFRENNSVNAKLLYDLKMFHSTEPRFIRKGKINKNKVECSEVNYQIENWIKENSIKLNIEFPRII